MRIISDIFAYTSQKMPKFNSISISGYHMQEAGATADLELAYTLADGVEYIRAGIAAGMDVDKFAPAPVLLLGDRHELLHGSGEDARRPPALGQAGQAVRPEERQITFPSHAQPDLRLVAHCAGRLQQRDPHLLRSHGGRRQGQTQSLRTNSFDEALALPTDFSARISRNTQLFLQQEAGTCRTIDTWGGFHLCRTPRAYDLARKAWAHIQEVEAMGGMAKAIEEGLPKLAHRGSRRQDAGPHRQRRADDRRRQQVPPRRSAKIVPVLKVDNAKVRTHAARQAQTSKSDRDEADVAAALDAITKATETNTATCSNSGSAAARAKATVGEIRYAIEKVVGRHQAVIKSIQGVYADGMSGKSDKVVTARAMADALREGRRPPPRILIAKMGQDGHDRQAGKSSPPAIRRPRLGRRHRTSVSDPRRGRPSGRRERRPHRRRLFARRRSPHAGA